MSKFLTGTILEEIKAKANLFSSLSTNELMLFDYINSNREHIDEVLETYKPLSVFKPVNMLRFLIANEIKKGAILDKELFNDIKNAVEKRDVSNYFILNDRVTTSLIGYKKSKRGMFPNWKNPFNILFPFIYSIADDSLVKDELNKLADSVINDNNLENVFKHIVTFQGAQNYGTDHVWCAIIPKRAPNVQSAYQLFFTITKNGLSGGIHKGHRLIKQKFTNSDKDYPGWDEFLNTTRILKDDWFQLNTKIDFLLLNDEKEFIKRLAKLNKLSLNRYFDIIDDLELEDLDNLVFSTGGNRLSFQVGKRICLNIKNDLFDFIAPISYELNNVESEKFTSPENAILYKKVGLNEIDIHYNQLKEAVIEEIDRDNHTNLKEYDNSAFRKAVFDKDYRSKFFAEQKYYAVGAYWNDSDPMDQTARFVKNKIWANGYDDKFIKEVKAVEIGSKIVIKSTYTRAKTKSVMLIKARGLVTDNSGDGQNLRVLWEEDFVPFEVDFSGGFRSTIKEVTDENHIKAIWGNYKDMRVIKEIKDKKSLNQILYGPPGTGKTFRLKEKYFPKYTSKETSLTKEKHFENIVKECSWWQVIAIALLELGKTKVSDIFEHPWVQQKAVLSDSKTVRPTLWGQLQSHTIEACEYVNVKNRRPPFIFNKTESSYWEILEEEVKEQVPELYELLESVNNFIPNPDNEIKRYVFTTFHQSFSYEDFIEGIKPIMPENGEESEDLGYKIEDGVFKQLCSDAENDPENRYAIFIDEINRGNVSSIFGELITLIESDKRKGAKNEIKVLLPYSKKLFSVPQNVDIYGTMNTADRSVEALDTALRRRFSFIEVMPDPELLADKASIKGVSLKDLLRTINERIEVLIDRDHTIGHAYFINVNNVDDLKETFKKNIIPLLQEYFFGDYGKIGLVLGEGFLKTVQSEGSIFAEFKNYDGAQDYHQERFELITIDDEFDIIKAIEKLLPQPKDV